MSKPLQAVVVTEWGTLSSAMFPWTCVRYELSQSLKNQTWLSPQHCLHPDLVTLRSIVVSALGIGSRLITMEEMLLAAFPPKGSRFYVMVPRVFFLSQPATARLDRWFQRLSQDLKGRGAKRQRTNWHLAKGVALRYGGYWGIHLWFWFQG